MLAQKKKLQVHTAQLIQALQQIDNYYESKQFTHFQQIKRKKNI